MQQPLSAGDDIDGGSQGDLATGGHVVRVSWKKDYFTVSRPFEQKGAAVTVPVNLTSGGSPIVTLEPDGTPTFNSNGASPVSKASGTGPLQTYYDNVMSNKSNLTWVDPALKVVWNGGPNTTGSISVDDIRQAFGLQRFEEARAMFGSRYTEYLRYLGVRSSDARLQRPEYLGGGSQVIQWSEVVQTGQGTDPVGTLRGHGVSGGRTRRWRRFFEEHCIVMTLATIRPIALYTQSLPRAWSRVIKEDYWQKELEHIGEQEVANKELYAYGSSPDGVFGYMDRYDEYRSVQNTVCGDFRDKLDFWHLGRVFASQPVLNSDFVSCNPSKRILS